MYTLESIYQSFSLLFTSAEKIAFLETLQSQNLPFDINYANLIKYYQTHV